MINFEDGILVSPAKVIIDGIEYEVIPAVWQGNTPLSAYNINRMQQELEDKATTSTYIVTTTETIAENTDYEIPCYYKVGNNSLDVFYQGENLIKDVHYKEIGNEGTISNKIQFYDWGQAVPANRVIKFVVRGVYSNES